MSQTGQIQRTVCILLALASWSTCTRPVIAQPSLIGRSQDTIQGVQPQAKLDSVHAERFLIDPPTLENLGFRWYVSGDSNRNATVTVAFREQGDSKWQEALPMLRIYHEIINQDYGPYRVGNLFAGSVLFLKPATQYEVKFTMDDPDGGAPTEPKIVSVATRGEPVAPSGDEIHATSRTGLMAAYAKAKPGDVILLHAGIYDGPFQFDKSGEPDKPIVFRGAGDGEAILQADGSGGNSRIVSIAGTDHLLFEDLTFRSAHTAIYSGKPGSAGITIRRCRIHDVVTGINTQAENSREWYIADNEIVGINRTWYPRPEVDYMSPAHTGVNVYGRGHVVCYNRISHFSDALAISNFGVPVEDVERHCVAIDFYGNDLSWAQDDTLETDYGCHNVRVHRNRCYNTHMGNSKGSKGDILLMPKSRMPSFGTPFGTSYRSKTNLRLRLDLNGEVVKFELALVLVPCGIIGA